MGAKNGKSDLKTKEKRKKDSKAINNNIPIDNDNITNINLQNSINSIKSPYIIKEIFSLLNEKKKLELIIYNKKLQNFFDIKIEDYKKKSRKYRIIDKKGFGKEYILNTKTLLFEGKYVKNKRNGIGKEYYENGQIKFIGNYLDGKRNGEGKKYYENGKIKFKGEYLNGNKLKGKGYNNKGYIIFILEKDGKGIKYYNNGKLKFYGEYLNGKKWNGKMYNIDGSLNFELYNGNGKIKLYDEFSNLIFEGEYLNGQKSGKSKEYYEDGKLKFEGEYSAGKRNGKGKEYDSKGKLIYDGEYLDGKKMVK